MNGLPYYKAYPRDFIEGTIGLPFELKAAYRLVLDLIYMQGGELPDDARYIAGLLGCSVRAWKGYREALISAGKIVAERGIISNFRARKELEISAKLQEKNAEKGRVSRKNNKIPETAVELRARVLKPDTEEDTASEDKSSSAASSVLRENRDEKPERKTERIDRILREAAGQEANPSPGLLVVGPIIGLLDAGCDLELDVLPTIRSVMARRPSFKPASWSYFIPAIQQAHADRIGASGGVAKPVDVDAEKWARRLAHAKQTGSWPVAEWGPMPGDTGCLVPESLLERDDGEKIKEARKAA